MRNGARSSTCFAVGDGAVGRRPDWRSQPIILPYGILEFLGGQDSSTVEPGEPGRSTTCSKARGAEAAQIEFGSVP
jgi:hypothetical protein